MNWYLMADIERNYSWDSYFYAVLFDGKNTIEEVEYGSTAFYGSPTRAEGYLEPTPEIRNRYYRILRVRSILDSRKEAKEYAKEMGLNSYHEARRLMNAFPARDKMYSDDWYDFKAIYNLLKVKRFRSEFRKNLSYQIREWCSQSNPQYNRPLSLKQMSQLTFKR